MKFKTIDMCDSINSYEWDEFHVLRGDDGYLYTAEGQGCSCYGFYEYFGDVDANGFTLLDENIDSLKKCDSWIQVMDYIKKWASEGYTDRDSVAFSLMSRIADLKPEAFDPSVVVLEQED